jgi:hypothetical protein
MASPSRTTFFSGGKFMRSSAYSLSLRVLMPATVAAGSSERVYTVMNVPRCAAKADAGSTNRSSCRSGGAT